MSEEASVPTSVPLLKGCEGSHEELSSGGEAPGERRGGTTRGQKKEVIIPVAKAADGLLKRHEPRPEEHVGGSRKGHTAFKKHF